MKNKTFITTVVAASVMLSGCATASSGTTPFHARTTSVQTDAPQPSTDKRRVAKSAGIGCLAGGALAYLTGKKDKAVAACAAGAVVGGVASYRKQLKEAEAIADAARDAGLDARVETKTVNANDGQSEALDALIIGYRPADMAPVSPRTAASLDKLGVLITSSTNELTVRFEGIDRSVCNAPRAELDRRGALSNVKVVDGCGSGAYRVVVSPMPALR